MKTKGLNIQVVFIKKDLFVSAYKSNKLPPNNGDIGFYFKNEDKKFEVYVQTNIGWNQAIAKTEKEAQKKLIELYEVFQNEYQYHLASLFTNYLPKSVTISVKCNSARK